MSSLERYIAINPGYMGVVPTTAEECEGIFEELRAILNPKDHHIAGDCAVGQPVIPQQTFLLNVWRDLEIICGGEQREIY